MLENIKLMLNINLENIKLMLNINDDKHDKLILLYLAKVETMVVDYCNVNELTGGLESFIEDKVISIVKPIITGGTQNTGEIKSISRGDTKIEYNVGDVVETSNGATLTSSDKEFLKQYRRARCW